MPAPNVWIGGAPTRLMSRRSGSSQTAGSRLAAPVSTTTMVSAAILEAGDFDILHRGAQRNEGDRRMADELLDGIDRKLRMPAQECPLVGVITQHVYRRTQLEAGGVGACQKQRGHEHAEFVGAEAIAIVLGADQLGDQVVGQCVPPVREHVVDVGSRASQAVRIADVSLAALQLKAFKMSSVQRENSSQSSAGAPSRAQMTGIGYRRAMSVTTSRRPWALWRSTSSVMMSTIVVRSRGVAWV